MARQAAGVCTVWRLEDEDGSSFEIAAKTTALCAEDDRPRFCFVVTVQDDDGKSWEWAVEPGEAKQLAEFILGQMTGGQRA